MYSKKRDDHKLLNNMYFKGSTYEEIYDDQQ